MTALIILAHPEPTSFNAAWAAASRAALEAAGEAVLVSDLCAMGFDAVEGRGHFAGTAGAFDVLKAQEGASSAGALPADVQAEVDKIRAADLLIFHFPLWWFAPPAILKGWCDRALVHGALHDVDNRFDAGLCRGKRALFCVTTGADAVESGPDGKEGDTRLLLWPLAQTLRYLGMTVLAPECVRACTAISPARRRRRCDRGCAPCWRTGGVAGGARCPPGLAVQRGPGFDDTGRLKPRRPVPLTLHPASRMTPQTISPLS